MDWYDDPKCQVIPDLGKLSELLQEREILELAVNQAEEQLKQAQAKLLVMNERTIPDCMAELQLSQVKMQDGRSVTVKRYVKANIPVAMRGDALHWLEDNGYGDLIKHEISLKFGKGEGGAAEQLKDLLCTVGFSYAEKEEIHASTLNSFATEMVETGQSLPDFFNVYIGNKTVVK